MDVHQTTLKEVIKSGYQLTEYEWMVIMTGVFNRLAAALDHGLVHGDLKPSNSKILFPNRVNDSSDRSNQEENDSTGWGSYRRFRVGLLLRGQFPNSQETFRWLLPLRLSGSPVKWRIVTYSILRHLGRRLHWL